MKLDPKIEKLIEQHAKRVGITKEQALDIVSCYFRNIKDQIMKSSYEKGYVEIYMPKLGEFIPNYRMIEKAHEVIENRKQQSL